MHNLFLSPFESLKFLQKGFVAGLEMSASDPFPLRPAAAVSARKLRVGVCPGFSLSKVGTFLRGTRGNEQPLPLPVGMCTRLITLMV